MLNFSKAHPSRFLKKVIIIILGHVIDLIFYYLIFLIIFNNWYVQVEETALTLFSMANKRMTDFIESVTLLLLYETVTSFTSSILNLNENTCRLLNYSFCLYLTRVTSLLMNLHAFNAHTLIIEFALNPCASISYYFRLSLASM